MGNTTVMSSSLAMDIEDIIEWNRGGYTPLLQIQFDLHTMNGEYGTDQGVFLQQIDMVRDYETAFGDYIQVVVMLQMGTYIHDIYPYLDNAEASLRVRRQNIYEGEPSFVTTRYKAVYLEQHNQHIPNTLTSSRNDLNQLPPIQLTLQLYNRGLEVLRIKTTQGCFNRGIDGNRMDAKSFLNSILVNECNKIRVEQLPIIDRISIQEPDNTTDLGSIVIPSGTRVLDIPKWLQESSSGVYNGGIGTYLQPYNIDGLETLETLFVYSPFGLGKFSREDYKAIIYSPLTSSVGLSDKNYSYDNRILRILANTVSHIPDHTARVPREGIGYRSAHALSYMDKPIEISSSGPEYMKYKMNNEVIALERQDGNNYAVYHGVTSNNHKLSSQIIANRALRVTVEVNSLDPDYIYPGMPVKFINENKNGVVQEYYGSIIGVVSKYTSEISSPIISFSRGSDEYRVSTAISIALVEGI